MQSKHETAELEVDWALQESYKRAVKLAGVTDWSKELNETQRHVETLQLEIAKMLLNSLHKRLFP